MITARVLPGALTCIATLLCSAQPTGAHPPIAPSASDADPTAPSADMLARYRQVVAHAVAEFNASHFTQARALFQQAHQLWPSARTLRTLGMTAFELRMYPTALMELQAALDDPRRPLNVDHRRQVAALIVDAHAFVGRYRVHVSPGEAEVTLDGTLLANTDQLMLSIGEHVIAARAPGFNEQRVPLVVQGGDQQELSVVLEPVASATPPSASHDSRAPAAALSFAPTPRAPEVDRNPAWIALGVSALGVAIGGVSGGVAFTKKHHDQDTGRVIADVSTAAFLTAGVAAALGMVLWITARPDTSGESTRSAQSTARPNPR